MKECGNTGGRTHADDVDLVRFNNGIHGAVKALTIYFFQGQPDLFHIRLQHAGQNVLISDPVIRHLDALHGGQTVSDHLLQGFLHTRITVIAQFRRKAHHGRFTDIHRLTQFAGRHESCLVIRLQNIVGDPFLSLGKGGHIFMDHRQNITIQVIHPLPAPLLGYKCQLIESLS